MSGIAPMSETMANLMARLDELQAPIEAARAENRRANLDEAQAKGDYELSYATAFLTASGSVRERECVAQRDTIALFRGLQNAIALRRASSEALSVLEKDLEALAALAHLGNRELKVLGA